MFLHDDGWLEVTIDMDSVSLRKRLQNKVETYKKMLPKYSFSTVRLSYLLKTIEFLKQHGNVYLVRLPLHPRMMELEQYLMPDFETNIQDAINNCNNYFDMTSLNSKFVYIDGNHLYKESGKQATQMIANWINNQEKHQ